MKLDWIGFYVIGALISAFWVGKDLREDHPEEGWAWVIILIWPVVWALLPFRWAYMFGRKFQK